MKNSALAKPSAFGLRKVFVGVAIIFCIMWFYLRSRSKKPPNYYSWYKKELALPQNDPNLPAPQGKHGKYLTFTNHVHTVGWGNVMQEMLVNAHLAYEANRIFVAYNYSWLWDVKGDYSSWGETVIPAHIPLSVYAAGPIAGGPYPIDAWRPPAVSVPFFNSICPNPTRLNVNEIKKEVESGSAGTIMDHFVRKLKSIDDNCVEFEANSGHVLDYMVFGDSNRMSDMFPRFLKSPILTDWLWSSLVTSALEANRAVIHPGIRYPDKQDTELPGLLALHIRRGDFQDHCNHLAQWKSQYNAFNTLSGFPDQNAAPDGGEWGVTTPESAAFYAKHCFPEIEDIVEKVARVRLDAMAQGRTLDRIYVLTNAKPAWFAQLKAALNENGWWNWKAIHYSRELSLTDEQRYIAQAIDMFIATRAEVFVGNAWSSLTSNVNMLRIAQNHSPLTTRFW